MLDATKADITAAHMAKADGQRREVAVTRAALRLTGWRQRLPSMESA